MTREEIIQGLQFTIDMFLFDPFTGESLTEPRNDDDKITIDACKEAIKILKAQPCEDAVSREAVMKLKSHKPEYGDMIYAFDVELLPPVTPKQRTGKWIKVVTETDSFGNETYHHECSVCKCNKSGWGEYRFCPNCGAKMEGESE